VSDLAGKPIELTHPIAQKRAVLPQNLIVPPGRAIRHDRGHQRNERRSDVESDDHAERCGANVSQIARHGFRLADIEIQRRGHRPHRGIDGIIHRAGTWRRRSAGTGATIQHLPDEPCCMSCAVANGGPVLIFPGQRRQFNVCRNGCFEHRQLAPCSGTSGRLLRPTCRDGVQPLIEPRQADGRVREVLDARNGIRLNRRRHRIEPGEPALGVRRGGNERGHRHH
jgi:hypothetical protein